MAVEYRKAFGPMEPGMSWHEVLAHVRRVRGLELRTSLLIAEGQALGQSSGDSIGQQIGQRYERLAFPERR